jgi:hypothetical protein
MPVACCWSGTNGEGFRECSDQSRLRTEPTANDERRPPGERQHSNPLVIDRAYDDTRELADGVQFASAEEYDSASDFNRLGE